MINKRNPILLLVLLTVVGACVSIEFEGQEEAIAIYPLDVERMGIEQGMVVWGGQIIGVHNSEEGTELQVLAYPLDGGNAPKVDYDSVGRFVVYYPGYLEPLDYAPGRWVSLAGELDGWVLVEHREDYKRSVPAVQSAQIHLWPKDPYSWTQNLNLGVGIHVSN